MDTYSILREFADSWMLLCLFAFFLGVVIWAFLPSQRAAREAASMIPFRNDTTSPPDCVRNCATCACTRLRGQIND